MNGFLAIGFLPNDVQTNESRVVMQTETNYMESNEFVGKVAKNNLPNDLVSGSQTHQYWRDQYVNSGRVIGRSKFIKCIMLTLPTNNLCSINEGNHR